jgi:predicted peptidase
MGPSRRPKRVILLTQILLPIIGWGFGKKASSYLAGNAMRPMQMKNTTHFLALGTAILFSAFNTLVLHAQNSGKQRKSKQSNSNKVSSPAKGKHYVKHSFTAEDGTVIDCWLMSPMKIEKGRQYPLVLALQGRGGNTQAGNELGSESLRKQFPCFVMAPASTKAGTWLIPPGLDWKKRKAMLPAALEAMDAIIQKHPIDPDRVYVTGQSMGGVGTFGALSLSPETFAAAIPVCGGWNPKAAGKMKDIAIWVFHGDNDKVVPTDYSRKMVAAIKQAGGSVKYTEYKGVAHNSWTQTYESPETWNWLFQQKR